MNTKTFFRAAKFASVCGAALISTVAISQSTSAQDETEQGDLAVTIYNNNLALVQDVREINIQQGQSRVEFPDVSARIRPQTLSFYAPNTTIIEQNFDYDLLTPTKMMEKAIGQTVTLLRTNPATGVETRERATVLSTAGGVVIRIGNRIEVLRDDGLPVRVIFDRVPPNLRARPTLSVNIDSSRAGARPVSLRYLSSGLGWSSDYVALYNEATDSIDMQGWVTLTNQTGTTFHQANTLLVAGNPNGSRGRGFGSSRGRITPGTESANRERLGDFYLYPIEGRTTIANAQTKQVSFLDVQGVPARKVYERNVGWLSNDSNPVNVTSAISFSSSRNQGLGDALPAGTVRFYQRDSKGTPQFIGENSIGHTPMGSELSLATGDAFDITVQAEVEKRETITSSEWERSARYRVIEDGEIVQQVDVERPKKYYRTTMRYTLTNAKDDAIDVDLTQSGLNRYWWANDYRIVSEDVVGEQINYDRRKWVVSVPAEGKRVVRVTYETRY
ncbi:DUF4139 domain-containing protein [Erythrobacter crassostreae]|uniref:DUF4139 domain-containing protein n=1 Tax=Erythrobacter crassostreae TaxID=2828328 RepID=A0A9X1F521_9SPHN|nr:DUF4139 domain-containing protein [Erythrobacter crassostrea]MBV7260371.1 DUF4139 domain-containing protein [Erythrobacter crassostrea]